MEGRYCAIIFFVVIGISAIHSLPHKSNLAAHVESRAGHNDLDSNTDLFDEAAGERFKRDRTYDYEDRERQRNQDERMANRRNQLRNDRPTQAPIQGFQQHMHAAIGHLMREDAPVPAARRNFGPGH